MLALGTYLLGTPEKGVSCHIVQARAFVLLLLCGLTRAFRLIIDNKARAFFMLVHKAGDLLFRSS